jgi:hypothetical protein
MSATARNPLKIRLVLVRPILSLVFKKSAKVSPTVVERTLIIQKKRVTSGTRAIATWSGDLVFGTIRPYIP